jgi:hypothetical protein
MTSRSYFDVVASLAAGETLAYANLNRDEQQHVRSLKAEALVKSVAKNGKAVLLNHPSALIRLTDDGEAYASLLVDSGIIAGTTPAASGAQPKAEAGTRGASSTTRQPVKAETEPVGRHAKTSAYAEIDARIAARESQAVKPAKKPRTRKASPVTTRKVAPKGQKRPRKVMLPQDLGDLRSTVATLNELLQAHDQFTDQYIR